MKGNDSQTLKVCLLAASVCCSGVSMAATPSATQTTRALTVEDVLTQRSFLPYTRLALSADGKRIAFAVQDNREDRGENDETSFRTGIPPKKSGIYIVDVETGESRSLFGNAGTDWGPSWSPDSRSLAFLSDRDGSGQARVWVWDRLKDKVGKVSDVDVRGNEIQWLPDSRKLLVTSLPEGMSPDDYVNRVLHKNQHQHPAGSSVVVFHSSGSAASESSESNLWNLDGLLRDLCLIDVSSGQTEVVVHGRRIAKYLASPDGTRIAYTSPKSFEKPGSQQILYTLSLIAIKAKEDHTLASSVRLDLQGGNFSWSHDGSLLVFRADGMEEKTRDCHVVNPETGTLRNITALSGSPQTSGEMRCLWDRQGTNIYFVKDGALWRSSLDHSLTAEVARIPDRRISIMSTQSPGVLSTLDNGNSTIVVAHDDRGKQDGIYKLDLRSGETTRLLEKGQCYTCVFGLDDYVAISRDGQRVAYFSEDARNPSDLWISDYRFIHPRRLTRLNPQFEEHWMGAARLIDWLSDDGVHLQGALLLPSEYQEGRRYPLVVIVYGGQNLSDGFNRFGGWFDGPFNMQLLATRGYAVFLPDAPERLGTPMRDLAKAVLPGVSKVVDIGIADPNRIGAMGHSKGGYGTLDLLVQTNRFKAALAIDGFGDLVSDYGYLATSGAAWGTWSEHMIGGTPWQYRDRFVENSPVFYLDRIETPLLIMHGGQDDSVPSFLADEIFVGLRRLGKNVEYAKYEGENHSPNEWSYANQEDFCNRMITWFNKYLMPKDP